MVKNCLALRKLFFISFVVIASALHAQNSTKSEDFSEMEAFESFQARKYESVIGDLKKTASRSQDEEILLLLSEIKTGKRDAYKVEKWLERNDKHPIQPLASYHLGEFYFYAKDTTKSKAYLASVSPNNLSTYDQASYGFIYGVLQLDDEYYENAKKLFQFSRRNGFSATNKLDYYEAFANYHLGDQEAALSGFEKAKSSEEFGTSSRFFIAKIQLENNQIDVVIALAQGELSDEKTITNSGFYQLIGEAFALKNNVAKADAYFERAIELHPGRPTAALYYQAGVSKFKIGNEDQAIEFLTEAGIQGGEYAYLSAFQLGRLYLKKQAFEKALFAYIEASASDDRIIKEEAYYHAAQINAKLGNYAEAINYSSDYLEKFENGSRVEQIQNLIAESYLRTSNYDLAINHLQSTGVSNNTQKGVYQKVTFQKAVLMFNDGEFVEAKKWFRESLKHTPSSTIKDQAYFHLGEIAMRSGDYRLALENYQNQTQIDPVSDYGIGYALYNQQKYERAIPYFRQAYNTVDTKMKLDAQVRLADCLYATKSYNEARILYNQMSSKSSSPYIEFQLGKTQKNLGKTDEAIQSFQKVFDSPTYGSVARFEVGMIHFEAARFKEAETYFTQVIEKYSDSEFVPEALLNRGITRKNLGKMAASGADYSAILEKYITSEFALNAILGLQELQQAGSRVNDLEKYIADYKKANPESGSLELIEFEAAKRQYFDFAYAEAAVSFKKYLKDYPASNNQTEGKYYLADSYYRIDQLKDSKEVFDDLKDLRNNLTGRILYRLGDINLRLGNTQEAKEAYLLLRDLNLTPKDTYNARQGLMMLYFESGSFNEAIAVANEIVDAEWKPLNGDKEAIMIKAKSYLNLGNKNEATDEFKKLTASKDIFGAEANYLLGLMAFQNSEYEHSLNTLFNLNANYGSYQDWVDRSYLLIAKNYIEMDELFQAKATLRSIIQHAKLEKVKSDAKTLLNQIEQTSNAGDTTQSKG